MDYGKQVGYTVTSSLTTQHTYTYADGCYTYESTKVALHLTECKVITGVHVPYANNNEPSHGGKG